MSRADHTLADDGMRQFTSRIYTAAKIFNPNLPKYIDETSTSL